MEACRTVGGQVREWRMKSSTRVTIYCVMMKEESRAIGWKNSDPTENCQVDLLVSCKLMLILAGMRIPGNGCSLECAD